MLRPFTVVVALSAFAGACRPGSQASQYGSSNPPGDGGASASGGGQTADAGSGDEGTKPSIVTQTVEYVPQCGPVPPRPDQDVGCGSWVLEAPLPQAHDLAAVWAVASDNVWAVGEKGAIVHWDGATWAVTASPTTANLNSVWAADAADVWAAGDDGVLLFFDGSVWQTRPSPTTDNIRFIRGSAADDVWASGTAAEDVFHWDGVQWTQPGRAPGSPTTANGGSITHPIWPAGGGRAWSGGCLDGANASIYLWDGTRWSRTDTGVPGCIQAIAGTSTEDVWATSAVCGNFCDSYRALHWDGVRWSEASTGLPIAGNFFSPAPGEVWFYSNETSGSSVFPSDAVFARRERGVFQRFLALPQIGWWSPMAATSPTDVFIVGAGGLLAHSDGKTTKIFAGPTEWLQDLWSDASGAAWAVGGGQALRRENGCWSAVDIGRAAFDIATGIGPLAIYGASASNPDDLWMTSYTFAIHWDGQSFSQHVIPEGIFLDAWVSPGGHAYFASTTGLYRADPNGFTRLDAPGPSVGGYISYVTAVWGTSDTDLWWLRGEGSSSAVVHFDGTSMTVVATIPWQPELRTVRARSIDDIWAIDWFGALHHFDGTSWKYLSPGDWIYHVAIAGPNDVWASNANELWHFDGNSWSKENAPPGALAVTAGAVYTLGVNGRICRKPARVPSPTVTVK